MRSGAQVAMHLRESWTVHRRTAGALPERVIGSATEPRNTSPRPVRHVPGETERCGATAGGEPPAHRESGILHRRLRMLGPRIVATRLGATDR